VYPAVDCVVEWQQYTGAASSCRLQYCLLCWCTYWNDL